MQRRLDECVSEYKVWQTGMGNGSSHLIPVAAYLSFQPGPGSAWVRTSSLHPRKYLAIVKYGLSKK